MNYINISINTYAILFLLYNYRILFLGEELDFSRQLSHLPKILLLDIFLKIPLLESWLYLDEQNLKILIYQSLVIIFLTREYFNLHFDWLESITGFGFDFICSFIGLDTRESEQQKKVEEKIRIAEKYKLEILELHQSNLKYIPQGVFELTHLKRLNLNDNRIRTIPKEIVNLNNLEVLCLNNNRLSVIPGFIDQLSSLKILALASNNLKQLPSSFGQLPNLNQIFLSDNRFTTFPLCLLKLDQLECLSLSYNQISELPEQLASMPNLRYLYISFNKIDDHTLKKSHIYRSSTNKPTHVFNRDTGKVEVNERLIIYNRVAEDSISIFKSEYLLKSIALTVSSAAAFGFVFKQQGIYSLIMSDLYFSLSVGVIMFLLASCLRRNKFATGIVKIVLLSIGIGLFLGWIYK